MGKLSPPHPSPTSPLALWSTHPDAIPAIATPAPVDLASGARALDERRGNCFYLRRFLKTLVAKATAKAQQFPGSIDPVRLTKIRTIRDFDEHVTAPLHGFAGAEDYWTRASSLPYLTHIRVPALLLNALNDPLLDQPSFSTAAVLENPDFYLETPAHGGHVGFPGSGKAGSPGMNAGYWGFWKISSGLEFPCRKVLDLIPIPAVFP